MQVVLGVAPEVLYNEMFTKVFGNSLFELSSHHCGNFVIQALISQARHKDQVCFVAMLLFELFTPYHASPLSCYSSISISVVGFLFIKCSTLN